MYYNNASVQPELTLNCDISTSSCSYTIDGLSPYTLYIIGVSCSTQPGEGPRTNTISVRTSIGSEFGIFIIKRMPTHSTDRAA